MTNKPTPEQGYPEGTPDRAALEALLAGSQRRLMKLSAMNAPNVILEGERRLIKQREGWLEAWDKEHDE